MKKSLVVFLIVCPIMMMGQSIIFSYDKSGNRISRKVKTPPSPPKPSVQSDDASPFGISKMGLLESRVYPVPVKETLTVEIGERMLGSQVHLTLFDISGQIIADIMTMEVKVEIDFNPFPKGAYLLIVSTSDLRESYKIIKN